MCTVLLHYTGCQPNVYCTAALHWVSTKCVLSAELHRVSTQCVLYCCTTPGVNPMCTVLLHYTGCQPNVYCLLHYTGCQPNVYCTAALHRVSTQCVLYCCTTLGVNQ